MFGLVRNDSGMLVPMVASTVPSWIRSSSDLLCGPCSSLIGLSSGSTVGEPCAPAALMAPCTQVHFGEIDAVVVLQDAADEDRRRHRVERNADALAFQVLRLGDACFLLMPMKAWRKQREGNTGMATKLHFLLA